MLKYSFAFLEKFKKDYKEAKKKDYTLDEDFEDFLETFDNTKGDVVSGTSGAQKIRLQRANKGKSGGYRVYYYFAIENKVYLLRLFSKSNQSDISIKEKLELSQIIKAIKETKSTQKKGN